MEFAHALEKGLAGFLIGRHAERRIFRSELRKCHAQLFLVGLRLRLDRDFDNRLREFHLFKDDRMIGIAQRIAGTRFLQTSKRHDIASECFLDVFAVVRMHQQHAADALFALLGRVDRAGAAGQRARIDTAERDGADEWIVHDFEGEQRHRRVVLRLTNDFFAFLVRVDALNRGNVERRRQIVDNCVEQRLHALVLEGRAAKNRIESAGDHSLADHALQGRNIWLFAVEECGQNFVVEFDGGFNQLLAIFLRLFDKVGRDIDGLELGTERFVVPKIGLHDHEIDHADEIAFFADRKLDRDRLCAETLHDVIEALVEVGPGLIHLVGENDARNLVLVALTPDGFGLRFNALVAVENDNGTVEHAQRTLDFNREVNVAGSIDDVQALLVPVSCRRSRRNGDATLLLLLHPIHRRGTFVHFADFVALAGIIKDALGGRGLAGVDMRHDTEVAVISDWMLARHGLFL